MSTTEKWRVVLATGEVREVRVEISPDGRVWAESADGAAEGAGADAWLAVMRVARFLGVSVREILAPGEPTHAELVAQLGALTALRPRDPRRTGHRCACCGREGAPDEDGLCPWCDGDIAREQELETLRARLHRARDVVEQIPMYLGATGWGQQLRAAMCEEAIRGRSE